MNRRLFTIVCALVCALSTYGVDRDSCQTSVLKDIYQHLKARGVTESGPVRTNTLGFRDVVIERNHEGVIQQIRTPLFAHDLRNNLPAQIADFVERYMLQLSLLSSADRSRQFFDDLSHLTPESPSFVDSLCQVQIDSNDKKYVFTWTSPKGEIAKLTFPKSFALITGQDMSERDKSFRNLLLSIDSITTYTPPTVSEEHLEKSDTLDYYIRRGPYYIIKPMKSDTYYVKDSLNNFIPLVDERYPEETLRNIFCRVVPADLQLQLNQHVYGLKRVPLNVNLDKFDYFCRYTNCKPYVGIEDITPEGVVKATVLYENVDLDYNHLLYIEVDTKTLIERRGIAKGFIMSYIPTHSLSNLYYENERKSRKR